MATNETSISEGATSETAIIHLTKVSADSLAVAHEDGSLVLWNVTTKLGTLLGRCESWITDLQVIAERYVVALGGDNTIQVFDGIHNAGILFNYQCENAISYLKAISPHCLVAACSDKTLRILDIFKGKVAVRFLEIVAKKLFFSPQRKILWPVPMPQHFPGFHLSGYLN